MSLLGSMSEKFYGSITVRLPPSMVEELDSKAGKGMKFRDRSDALRSFVSLGMQIDAMMETLKDPEKAKEFQTKFTKLLKTKDVEKTLETMTENDLNHILFLITNIKDKKVKQLLLEIKQS